MRERALLLDAPALDAAGHMALDEALLDAAAAEERSLRFYRWFGEPPHGLTFGYSQHESEARRAAERRRMPVYLPRVRRLTGGGVVFHDGDITFSSVFPWDPGLTPGRIYGDIHLCVHLALREKGLVSEVNQESAAAGGSGAECFSKPEPMDLLDGSGAKFLGGALRRRKGFGLYQGSLRPGSFRVSAQSLIGAIGEAFALRWRMPLEGETPPPAVNAAAVRLRAEKYSTETWNGRR